MSAGGAVRRGLLVDSVEMSSARVRAGLDLSTVAAGAMALLLLATLASSDLWRAMQSTIGLYEPVLFALAGAFVARASARRSWLRRVTVAGGAALAAVVVPLSDWLAVAFVLSASVLLAWPWSAPLRRGRLTVSALVGLIVIGGAIGWLLPYRVHFVPVYVASLAGIAVWRWHIVPQICAYGRWRLGGLLHFAERQSGIRAAVMGACVGLLAWLLVASGLPRVQFDDLYYHLWLPYQLQDRGVYLFDAGNNAWAVAPWMSDVWLAMLMFVKGGEPRALLNWALVLAIARLVWLLTTACRANGTARWLAVLCFVTVPITVQVMHGTQTETASAAVVTALLWALAARMLRPVGSATAQDWTLLGVLVGGLLALKTSNALYAAPLALLSLAGVRHAQRSRWIGPLRAAAAAVAVGASSYVYAWLVSGNPVFPLFNALFGSPLFDASASLTNSLYTGKFDANALYNFIFRSWLMAETDGPIGGFHLALLLPLAAVGMRRSRLGLVLLLATLVGAVAVFSQQQYIRYLYPAMPMVAVAIGSGARLVRFGAHGWHMAIMATAASVALLLNAMFAYRSMWIYSDGVVVHSPLAGERAVARFEEELAGEKAIAARLRSDPDFKRMRVLTPFLDRSFAAPFGAQGVWGFWQNYRLGEQINAALSDVSGTQLMDVLWRNGISHVSFHAVPDTPAWQSLLSKVGELQMQVGVVRLVRLALEAPLTVLVSDAASVTLAVVPAKTVVANRLIADIRLVMRCAAGMPAAVQATWTLPNGDRSTTWLGVVECAGGLAQEMRRSVDVPAGAATLEVSLETPAFRLESVDARLRPDVSADHEFERFARLDSLLRRAR